MSDDSFSQPKAAPDEPGELAQLGGPIESGESAAVPAPDEPQGDGELLHRGEIHDEGDPDAQTRLGAQGRSGRDTPGFDAADGVESGGDRADGVGSDGVGSDGVGSDGVGSGGVGFDGVGFDGVGSDGVGSGGVESGGDRAGGDRAGIGSDGVGSGGDRVAEDELEGDGSVVDEFVEDDTEDEELGEDDSEDVELGEEEFEDDESEDDDLPAVEVLLNAAVGAVGGVERPGQVKMAQAVRDAIAADEHVAVQAGTGTGKSLAYLVPTIRHAIETGNAVVISTATIALQRQLVDRDLPRLAEALSDHLPHEPQFAILKGRRNYLCRYKMTAGMPDDEPEELFDPRSMSATGRMVQRIQEWAEETETGDRDELVPGVSEQAWRQFSVSARECLGVQRCPSGADCYAELARTRAAQVDVVVTNHALLAIDAMEDFLVLPEHDVVVVDEAHELVDRVTSVVTDELSEPGVSVAVRRCGRLIEQGIADRLQQAGEDLSALLGAAPPGRLDQLPQVLGTTLTVIRDAAHACVKALGPRNTDKDDPENAGLRKAAFTALDEVHDASQRILDAFGMENEVDRAEVVWLEAGSDRRPPTLRVAPLSVGGMLREKLFGDRTVILTSATLAIGGTFDGLARQWGLGDEGWSSLDVGSPFDHPRSGILYVAKHLPQPGRDGLQDAYLDELVTLIEAAGGRTLGLFSSMRAARQAADVLRDRLEVPLLCQGDDSTSLLVKQFAEDPATCLFGTLSLWQGVDVPGPSLSLVVIDRIPFPRPDDPLASARQRHVAAKGGNGFMAVAATHAALLLAQGAGRLLRSQNDRGVVAILDPRLATARYGSFLRDSLPPFWATTDRDKVLAALRRLKDTT